MKNVMDETEIIRTKYLDDIKFSYITNGNRNYIKIHTDKEDKSDIELIYKSLETKLVKKDNELILELDPIKYEDSPSYYLSTEAEAVFFGLYTLIKENLPKLRKLKEEETANLEPSNAQGVEGSSL